MRFLRIVHVLIIVLSMICATGFTNRALAWEAGPTGMCCDADGNCGPCVEGPTSEPSEDVYMPRDSDFPPRISETQRRRNESNAINEQCVAYANSKDYDSAIPCYERALAVDTTNEVVQKNLKKAKALKANDIGIKYYSDRDWSKAAQYFKEALGYMPDDANLKSNLRNAEDALKLGEWQEAQAEQETKIAEAKGRVNKVLDNLSGDFDKGEPSSSSLEFMGTGQTLFEKGAPGATPVDLTFMKTGKPPAVKPPGVKEEAVPVSHEFKEEMARLDKEYWDLEEAIKKEKDPIKRAELINRQSYLRSQMGVLELEILDQYKEEQEMPARTKRRTDGSLMLAASEMNYGHLHYEKSLEFLHWALEDDPDDRGIQRAINYVNYLKELKDIGVEEFDPKRAVLVDALTYAKDGDWNVTFNYLERAAKDNPDDLAIRDALNVIDGISSHPSDIWAKDLEREAKKAEEAHKAIAKGLDAVKQNDFESAYKLFKQAHQLAPNDNGVRDAMYFADGVVFKSPRGKRGEWQREKNLYFDLTEMYEYSLVIPELKMSDDAQKLFLKSIKEVNGLDYESALKLMKQAHELSPGDLEVRDKMNWLEGICSQRYSVTRQKNNLGAVETK